MRRVPGYLHSDIVRWFRTGWGFPELQFPVGFFLPQYLPVRGEWCFRNLHWFLEGGLKAAMVTDDDMTYITIAYFCISQ